MTAPVFARPRGRSLARRPPGSSYPHIAATDRHLPAAVAAVAGALKAIKVDGAVIERWAGAVSPELVAHLAGPVAKRDPLTDVLAAAARDAASVSVEGGFGGRNDDAVRWAQARAGDLIAGINDETRRLIADQVARGQAGDLSAQQIAAKVRDLISLTPAQANAVSAYRKHLEQVGETGKSGKAAAGTVANAFGLSPWQGGKLTPAKVDKLVGQYRDRMVKQRAETIARTEMIRAANEGDRLAWQRQVDQGGTDGMVITREWSVTRDDRACKACLRLDGDKLEYPMAMPGSRPNLDSKRFPGGLAGPPAHPRCRCTVLTTLELGDEPLPPEPEQVEPEKPAPPPKPVRAPKTFAEKFAARQTKAAAKMRAARGDGGRVPSRALADAEAEVTKVGKALSAEADRRAKAAGAVPFGKVKEAQYKRVNADAKKASDEFWRLADGKSTARATPAQKDRARTKMNTLLDKQADLRRERKAWQTARTVHMREVLAEVRPMGGHRFEIGDHQHQASANFTEKMADVAERFPSEWLEASNRRGKVRVVNAARDRLLPGRAYYLDSEGKVSLTPRQASDLEESTAAHEFMHRMEYTVPEIRAAEWAFWERRRGSENPRTMRELTGNPGYQAHEVAVEDEFDNPYMGKVYDRGPEREDQAWEVMTMGVESIYHGTHVIDEDYRSFVLGVLSTL